MCLQHWEEKNYTVLRQNNIINIETTQSQLSYVLAAVSTTRILANQPLLHHVVVKYENKMCVKSQSQIIHEQKLV